MSANLTPPEELCAYVMRHYARRLTPRQLRGPWTFIGSYAGEISGVDVPADGDVTGYRVMLADLDAVMVFERDAEAAQP